MKIVLDEEALINKSLLEKYVDENNPSLTAKLMVKYYFSIGMDKNQVRNSIESFMKENHLPFNTVKWKDRLDRIVGNNRKNPNIVKIEKIHITQNELNIISTIGNDKLERVAFVYLVYSKIFNYLSKKPDYWVNEKIGEILKDTKITKGAKSTKEQQQLLNDLHDLGLIEYARRVDCTNDRVLFADEKSEVIITITDFRDFVYEYLKWKGEKITTCEFCPRLFKITGKNQRMCRECWKLREKEIWRESKRKIRKN